MKKTIIGIARDLLITLALTAAATAIGVLFSRWGLQETNVVVVYLLSVLLAALFTRGYCCGILATVLSLCLFNWFFTAPYFTLKVNDPTYILTFFVMSFTAVITSALTTKVKEAARISREKEAETNALYRMTNQLTDAEDTAAIAAIAVKTVSSVLACDGAIVCFTEEGEPEKTFIQQKGDRQLRRELRSSEDFCRRMAMLRASFDEDDEFCNYPVYGRSALLAVLRIPKKDALALDEAQTRMVYAIIENTSLALERLCSLQAQAKSREEAMQEHYRGNLLRAISHDLRTPLSGIMGSAEMLMGMTPQEDPRYGIAAGVYQDADWLHSLVENILNLTRLHDGRLELSKQPEAVEEVIGAAMRVMDKRFPDRTIAVSIPDDLVLVPMDARLITQVLINLLDNAVKHTPKGREIRISARLREKEVAFAVSDRGKGIQEDDLNSIFEMFYTTRGKSSDAQRGIGLGLTICQSIVEAHGGSITARNRANGGAEFVFTLPLGGDAA